jgi:hypothetical protein
MEDWDFTQGFYYGLSQDAKEHIDNLVGGTFFLLKTQEAWQNYRVQFLLFWTRAYDSCPICVQTHFGDSAGDSTTSCTSSMKGENSGTNGSNINKNNIIKPIFDTLTKEDRMSFEAYRRNLEELFLSHCKVMWQGIILKDTTSIIFH